ncbi:aminotransferase class III-fold pyridoxal phosphate-dependent enzyme, partial [Mycolicibacterium smegmatis]
GYHCAQGYFGVTPDLTCLGKVIGGGLPVGAFGGKKEIMDHIAPLGNIYQAGTLSGNPLAMTSGYETLSQLTPETYEYFNMLGDILEDGLKHVPATPNAPIPVDISGPMIASFFAEGPVTNFEEAKTRELTVLAEN